LEAEVGAAPVLDVIMRASKFAKVLVKDKFKGLFSLFAAVVVGYYFMC
jgi:hypothetical protein